MTRPTLVLLIVCGLLVGGLGLTPVPAEAASSSTVPVQGSISFHGLISVPGVISSVGKALAKFFGKQGGEEAAEYMARQGSRELVERVSASAAREGGEEVVEQVTRVTGKYGPEALAALDNSPAIMPVINAIDELPPSQVPAALARLSAGKPGRELAETIGKYGSVALRSELKHPGVGMTLVRTLGDDGAELASRLSTDQAIAVGRHAGDIAKLPLAQRTGVLSMIRNESDRMVSFMGRFVEQNPGKSLFTVAATTVILAQPDRILGGDEVVFDEQGNPVVVSKAGLVGRSLDAGGGMAAHISHEYLQPIYFTAMVFLGALASAWLLIKLWQIRTLKRAAAGRLGSKS